MDKKIQKIFLKKLLSKNKSKNMEKVHFSWMLVVTLCVFGGVKFGVILAIFDGFVPLYY
jgi:hypothetical protein